MKVNVIYDSRRIEKYEPLINELTRQHIDFEIWPCLMYPDIVFSINASHKMIVAKAKKEGLVEVCIGEDDLMFPNENGFEWFLKNKPNVYDIYAACNYVGKKPTGQKGAFRSDVIVGFQLYVVHSRYYDTFLNTPDKHHIDAEQKSPLMYFCYPHAALQRPGFSANNKTICNYNSVLKPEDIY
jgi:hypothetical protein